jgi:hypothetical protein
MAKNSAARWLLPCTLLTFSTLCALGADVPGNLLTNGGFEAGMQIWKGDGKIILLPDGNRVCEIEASKSRLKEIKQEFRMKQLQQVEVLFRARSLKYSAPELRISIHQPTGGSLIYNRPLPADGSWKDFRLLYTRAGPGSDLRELIIATMVGTGQVQIDNVEVREPSQLAGNQPSEPTAPPAATPVPATPPPMAMLKPPSPPVLTPAATPSAKSQPPSMPAGTFISLEAIVNSAPADTLKKLENEATYADGVSELDAYFTNNVKGKPARFHVGIDETRPGESKPNRFLIHVTDRPVTSWNGIPLTSWMWIRFTEEAPVIGDKLNKGSDLIISGVITRCLVGKGGRFHLDVDFGQSKLEGL